MCRRGVLLTTRCPEPPKGVGGAGERAAKRQGVINMKAGARTRVSMFLAGVFLFILVVVLNPVVSRIPMAALVAVMFVVAYSTFDWQSIARCHLRRMPKSETAVMVVTVALTVATRNLSIGVAAGVIVAALLFARRVQHAATVVRVTPDRDRWHLHLPGHHSRRMHAGDPARLHAPSDLDGHSAVYAVNGELFFASSSDLADRFDYAGDPAHVVIDLSDAHIWDSSTVAALDRIVAKYAQRGKTVEPLGMRTASRRIHEDLAGQLAPSH